MGEAGAAGPGRLGAEIVLTMLSLLRYESVVYLINKLSRFFHDLVRAGPTRFRVMVWARAGIFIRFLSCSGPRVYVMVFELLDSS